MIMENKNICSCHKKDDHSESEILNNICSNCRCVITYEQSDHFSCLIKCEAKAQSKRYD